MRLCDLGLACCTTAGDAECLCSEFGGSDRYVAPEVSRLHAAFAFTTPPPPAKLSCPHRSHHQRQPSSDTAPAAPISDIRYPIGRGSSSSRGVPLPRQVWQAKSLPTVYNAFPADAWACGVCLFVMLTNSTHCMCPACPRARPHLGTWPLWPNSAAWCSVVSFGPSATHRRSTLPATAELRAAAPQLRAA